MVDRVRVYLVGYMDRAKWVYMFMRVVRQLFYCMYGLYYVMYGYMICYTGLLYGAYMSSDIGFAMSISRIALQIF